MEQKVTKKHRLFVAEPMCNKLVTSVPGIGEKIGKKMTSGKDRITLAKQLYDIYLEKGYDGFKAYVQSYGAHENYAIQAANAMKEWHNQYGIYKAETDVLEAIAYNSADT